MSPPDRSFSTVAAGLSAVAVLAAGYLYSLSHARSWRYVALFAVLAIAWLIRAAVGRRLRTASGDASREIDLGISMAALIVIASCAVKLAAHVWSGDWESEMQQRVVGFMCGVVAMAFANGIPKRASSARMLATLRVVGWSLVLGGAGYALASLFAPLAYATPAAISAMGAGLAVAFGRLTWCLVSRRAQTDASAGQ